MLAYATLFAPDAVGTFPIGLRQLRSRRHDFADATLFGVCFGTTLLTE